MCHVVQKKKNCSPYYHHTLSLVGSRYLQNVVVTSKTAVLVFTAVKTLKSHYRLLSITCRERNVSFRVNQETTDPVIFKRGEDNFVP